jgi:mono/diheme cytochrome c family protein
MRHLLANIVTYAVAMLLVVGALLFARMRSSQYALTYERVVLAQYRATNDVDFRWRELGPATYIRNCRSCHAADGRGWDQYPPLTPPAAFVQYPEGRAYLVDVHLYGLTSERWGAPMPPMGHLHDVEVAAVLNYMIEAFMGLEEFAPFTPAEVAARRGQDVRPRDVNRLRPE